MMKRLVCLLLALCVILAMPAYADGGSVTYSGDAGEFVFAPGSDNSLTDLFPNFKDVMPGDKLTQQITVKNDASEKVKVKIYIRSLGAHEDSVEFLSQLKELMVAAYDNDERICALVSRIVPTYRPERAGEKDNTFAKLSDEMAAAR